MRLIGWELIESKNGKPKKQDGYPLWHPIKKDWDKDEDRASGDVDGGDGHEPF
jgi:hypothetical protein